MKRGEPVRRWALAMMVLQMCALPHAQSVPVDAPAPAAGAPVQVLLDRAESLSFNGPGAALAELDGALRTARETGDLAGEGSAQERRAEILGAESRGDEARAAWEAAERAWATLEYAPRQIKAVGWQAMLQLEDAPARSTALVERAIALTAGDRRTPRAAAATLLELGTALAARGRWALASRALEAGIELGSKLAPDASPAHAVPEDVLQSRADARDALLRCVRALRVADALTDDPSPVLLATVQFAQSLHQQREFRAARTLYEEAVAVIEHHPDWPRDWMPAFVKAAADMAFESGEWQTARDHYTRALAGEQELAPDSAQVARLLRLLGRAAQAMGDHAAARDYSERALTALGRTAPDSHEVSRLLVILGALAMEGGDLATARDEMTRALAIRERSAPDSLDLVEALTFLGLIEAADGATAQARSHYQRALSILQTSSPDAHFEEITLTLLRSAAWSEGDLDAARAYGERAAAARQRFDPDSIDVAVRLNLVGAIAREMGDFASARQSHVRALAIAERLDSGSLAVADALVLLGNVASLTGDRAAARDYHERAHAIRSRLTPDSAQVASSLEALAGLADDDGDRAAGRRYRERALAIQERLDPGSYATAASLNNLAGSAAADGDLDTAAAHFQRSLAIVERVRPNSVAFATGLHNLGSIALSAERYADAEAYFERALAINERLAPGSVETAIPLSGLAQVRLRTGDIAGAVSYGQRAWRAVRNQAAAISGDQAKQAFNSRYRWVASRLIDVQIAAGQTDEAFATLEESRSQSLLLLLASRDLAQRLAPPDVWRRYMQAQGAADRAGQSLERTASIEEAARAGLEPLIARGDLQALETRRRTIADLATRTAEARRVETRARLAAEDEWSHVLEAIDAALPAPITAAAARAVLPAGTVVAAFSAGEFGHTLFLLEPDRAARAFRLEIAADDIAGLVDVVLRGAAQETRQRSGVVARIPRGPDADRGLFQRLFPPEARAAIANARTLIVSPDGDLWTLPFAALVTNEDGPAEYLGLQVPLVYTQSLAVYAQTVVDTVRSPSDPSRAASAAARALIIGNPLYDNRRRQEVIASTAGAPAAPATLPGPSQLARPAGSRLDGELGALSQDGTAPAPLPYAEQESAEVAALYDTTPATGVEPTESWFRQRAADAEVIHLATHGYFNPRQAMSSGVRLAVPESEDDAASADRDGALQGWEVMQMRLRADLVVLSACQTGAGESVGGEGLIGLTRAFQVAGAATIVATQWDVADRSTATAMVAFHRELLNGVPKDQALRTAMRELAADPATAHPYYWAPFILIGDAGPLRGAVRR